MDTTADIENETCKVRMQDLVYGMEDVMDHDDNFFDVQHLKCPVEGDQRRCIEYLRQVWDVCRRHSVGKAKKFLATLALYMHAYHKNCYYEESAQEDGGMIMKCFSRGVTAQLYETIPPLKFVKPTPRGLMMDLSMESGTTDNRSNFPGNDMDDIQVHLSDAEVKLITLMKNSIAEVYPEASPLDMETRPTVLGWDEDDCAERESPTIFFKHNNDGHDNFWPFDTGAAFGAYERQSITVEFLWGDSEWCEGDGGDGALAPRALRYKTAWLAHHDIVFNVAPETRVEDVMEIFADLNKMSDVLGADELVFTYAGHVCKEGHLVILNTPQQLLKPGMTFRDLKGKEWQPPQEHSVETPRPIVLVDFKHFDKIVRVRDQQEGGDGSDVSVDRVSPPVLYDYVSSHIGDDVVQKLNARRLGGKKMPDPCLPTPIHVSRKNKFAADKCREADVGVERRKKVGKFNVDERP